MQSEPLTNTSHSITRTTPAEIPTPPSAWRAQPNEPPGAHLAFLWWALCEGELREEYAARWDWARRRQVIETFEGLASVSLADMGAEAAAARVRIAFAEIMKLQARSFESPDNVLSAQETFQQVQWMQEASIGLLERRAAALDWSKLTPEDRETMIAAKRIQDRLMLLGA